MLSSDLSGRRFLITGATGGVGMEAARSVLAAGAEVLIGTRVSERYEAAAAALGGDRRIHPFVCDIRDEHLTRDRIHELRDQRLEPTDVIHCAAAGLESLLRDLVRISIALRRKNGIELERAHREAMAELERLSEGALEEAVYANLVAPSNLLDAVAKTLPPQATIVYFTSLWSSFQPHPQVPAYYQSLADSKQRMERWLEKRAEAWSELSVVVISSPVVIDTRMGEIIDRHCASLMPGADRERWRSTFVRCSDLVEAMLAVITPPERRAGFRRVFLPGDGRVVSSLDRDDWTLRLPVAFARNSPTWASPASPATA